jgi:arylsulfatase A-like enzyme
MTGVSKEVVAKLDAENNNIDYRSRDRLYRQAIAEIDWSVGRILDTLKDNGLDENTLVIFTSDNGPPRNSLHASPGTLRGNKGSAFEGGMREPTVIRWPGRIPAGKDNDQLMTAMDLLPTFAAFAGAKVPTDRVIDGKDVSSVLVEHAQTPHKAFFYHEAQHLRAVRSGKWKLHLKGATRSKKSKKAESYDLESDESEKHNVIADHPKVAQRLQQLAAEFKIELAENSRPAVFVKNPQALAMPASAAQGR